jgi:hypothetical protein
MRTSNSIEGRRAQEADAVVPPVLRLLITPGRRKPGSFVARLESSEQAIVAHSRQPVTDACRELLARGHDPAALLTMRHITKSHDSFAPLPIGQWAKWTYKEREKGGLAVERWMPFAVPRSGQSRYRAGGRYPSPAGGQNRWTARPRAGNGRCPVSSDSWHDHRHHAGDDHHHHVRDYRRHRRRRQSLRRAAMTVADATAEVDRLMARNRALRSEIDNLLEEIRNLRWQLAEAPWVEPYDQPAAVLETLTDMLRGWPTARWLELAKMINRQVRLFRS